MSIYKNNLSALSKIDKDLHGLLKNVTTNKNFEVFLAEDDIIDNVKIVDNRDGASIHQSAEELGNKIKEFEKFDNYHSLYFFGIGTGVLYQELLKNRNHKSIIVFEPEIELIYIASNLIDFSKDILNHRFQIKFSELVTQENIHMIISNDSKLFLKTYNLHLYSDFYEKYSEESSRVNSVILALFKQLLHKKGDSLEDTFRGFTHSSNRISEMIKSLSLFQLVQKIKNRKNVVLVSTGPSLYKQLPLLKKVREYITIICADASFPILSKEGIKPDIVLSMERDIETAKFYADTPNEFHKDVVFLISTVCHSETFRSIDSSGILIPFMRADKHNMILGLDEWGYLGGGMSCANYLYNLAMEVGFENFTFIGQDLAYAKDGSSHCKNHVYGADERGMEEASGYIVAYGGVGTVLTMKYWHMFLNDFIFQIDYTNKKLNMKTYNSTEGGARIPGTIEIPFQEFCDKFVDLTKPKEKIVLGLPSKELIEKNRRKYVNKQNEIIKIAKSVSKNAKKSFTEIEIFLAKIKDYNAEDIIKNVSMKELDKLNKRLLEVKNKYNSQYFLNIFSTLLSSYIGHLEFDIAKVNVMRENTPEAIKLKKVNWIKIHYEWLYRLYATLDEIIRIIEDSLDKPTS